MKKLIILGVLVVKSLTVDCQTLEIDGVKISYEELRFFLEQDTKAIYCDTLLSQKDSLIAKQDSAMVELYLENEKVKEQRKWIWKGSLVGAFFGFLIGILVAK